MNRKIKCWEIKAMLDSQSKDSFSTEACDELLKRYEREHKNGNEIDLIDFCSEWVEYTQEILVKEYDYLVNNEYIDLDDEDLTKNILDKLREITIVVKLRNQNYLIKYFAY